MPDWVQTEIDRMSRRAEDTASSTAEQLGGIGRITGRARSADGSITVVVSPGGTLRDVTLTPPALRLGPQRLAREIVAVAERAEQRASAELHRRLAAVLDEPGRDALTVLGLPPPQQPRQPDRDADTTWLRRAL